MSYTVELDLCVCGAAGLAGVVRKYDSAGVSLWANSYSVPPDIAILTALAVGAADHVFGFILCFAKNFHTYIRRQAKGVWHVLGRAPGELPGYGGPGEVHPSDEAAITLGDCTLTVIPMFLMFDIA